MSVHDDISSDEKAVQISYSPFEMVKIPVKTIEPIHHRTWTSHLFHLALYSVGRAKSCSGRDLRFPANRRPLIAHYGHLR
ncbi:hypothetical protein CEXT_607151 [Caerostris extrusa]|uniref:Uncharacterized protein n=1 Tax=Caerostris extrusa TaxID=172846 RepID=A0AAV4NG20_CAEEX|nr:hypothetical protein CEXT_607151 [Caerostris extrusa]